MCTNASTAHVNGSTSCSKCTVRTRLDSHSAGAYVHQILLNDPFCKKSLQNTSCEKHTREHTNMKKNKNTHQRTPTNTNTRKHTQTHQNAPTGLTPRLFWTITRREKTFPERILHEKHSCPLVLVSLTLLSRRFEARIQNKRDFEN